VHSPSFYQRSKTINKNPGSLKRYKSSKLQNKIGSPVSSPKITSRDILISKTKQLLSNADASRFRNSQKPKGRIRKSITVSIKTAEKRQNYARRMQTSSEHLDSLLLDDENEKAANTRSVVKKMKMKMESKGDDYDLIAEILKAREADKEAKRAREREEKELEERNKTLDKIQTQNIKLKQSQLNHLQQIQSPSFLNTSKSLIYLSYFYIYCRFSCSSKYSERHGG
jgi:hypothetical protein